MKFGLSKSQRSLMISVGTMCCLITLALCPPALADTGTTDDGAQSTPTIHVANTTIPVSTMGTKAVTLKGQHLDGVRAAHVAGKSVPITAQSEHRLTIETPPAKDYQPRTVIVQLYAHKKFALKPNMKINIAYRVTGRVGRQLQYAMAHVKHRNPAYINVKGANCQNFVSQTLVKRGWKKTPKWKGSKSWAHTTRAWVNVEYFWRMIKKSSYAHKRTLLGHDSQRVRARVKVGDLVFADWNTHKKSWRKFNHVMIVSKITKSATGHINIYMAGNTLDAKYRDLDKLSHSKKDWWGPHSKDYIKMHDPDFYFVGIN